MLLPLVGRAHARLLERRISRRAALVGSTAAGLTVLAGGGWQPAHAQRATAAQGEATGARFEAVGVVLTTQHLQHGGILPAEQTERNQSSWTDQNGIPVAVDLAVAAQTVGMDGDGLHHRPPPGHERAFAIQYRKASSQERDIRGRAAHVGDDDILLVGEMARPHDAGGRTR